MTIRSRSLELLAVLAATGGAVGAAMSWAPGCSSAPCTQVNADSRRPSSAVECPSGTLCYQGACVPSCSAGAERSDSEMCETDGDCSNGARPNCVDGFCSSCLIGEACLPELNLCAPLSQATVDGGIRDGGSIMAREPLDGGRIDGSILTRDAGFIDPRPNLPPTHVGSVELVQQLRVRDNVTTASISARILDVRGTGYVASATVALTDASGTRLQNPFIENDQRCEVLSQPSYPLRPPVSASIGPIIVEPPSSDPGIGLDFDLDFSGGQYTVTPNPLPPLLIFSQRSAVTNVIVRGSGLSGVFGPWPGPPDTSGSAHVPLQLIPSPATRNLLTGGPIIAADVSAQDGLRLEWDRVVERSLVVTSALEARIEGPRARLTCTVDEGPAVLILRRALLEAFLLAQPEIRGRTLTLEFERRSAQQVPVPPIAQDVRAELFVRVRHTLVHEISF